MFIKIFNLSFKIQAVMMGRRKWRFRIVKTKQILKTGLIRIIKIEIKQIQFSIYCQQILFRMTTQRQFVTMEQIEPRKISESVRSDSIKYMKWGQPQYNIQNYYHHQHNEEKGQAGESQVILPSSTTQMHQQNYQHFEAYNQYIDVGFKKNKNNQIYKLSQLKHEYQILKSIKIQDQVRHKKDIKKEPSLSSSNSEASISRKSKDENRSRKKSHTNNISGNEYYEKQKLELMLSQTMRKLQHMFNNEMQYKRIIHQLNLQLDGYVDQKQKLNNPQKMDSNRERQLENQIERLRTSERREIEKIGFLEGELAVKEVEIKRVFEENINLNKEISAFNNKIFDYELELKKLRMENQLMVKEKTLIINRFQRNISEEGNTYEHKELHKQLSIKEEENQELLKEIQKLKHQNESIKEMLERIQNSQKKTSSDPTMINEIRVIKSQIENLSFNQSQEDRSILQSRVYQLEKIISEENEEKIKFMEELKEMAQDYRRLKDTIEEMQRQERRLKKQIQNLRNQLSSSENANLSLSNSQVQLNNLQVRVKFLESVERENENLQGQIKHLKSSKDKSVLENEQVLRELRRRIDEKDFQVTKLKKQNIFNLELDEKKAKAEIQLSKNSQRRAESERDEWKKEYESMKLFYEEKENVKQIQLERIGKEFNEKIQEKAQENGRMKEEYEQMIKGIRERHDQEQSNFIARLDSLTQTNERFASQNQKYIKMESQLYELRQKYKGLSSLNNNVNHLWEVKEVEYSNINEILKTVNNR